MTKPRPIWKYINDSEPGRKRLFDTPHELWARACEYFEYADKKKISKQHWVGKDGDEVSIDTPAPFLMEAFYLFTGITKYGFRSYKRRGDEENANPTTTEIDKEFKVICEMIENVVFTQNFELAVAGLYNPMLVARKLGLRERSDITSNDKEIKSLGSVSIELPEGVTLNDHLNKNKIEDATVVEEDNIRRIG